jgi:alpha-D-ribose 1-methylphosphonate 5-triphosphate synthase subunit PhnI
MKLRSRIGLIAMMTLLARHMQAGSFQARQYRPPAQKPRGYGVHLGKAERKGKTPAELQAMREARLP